MAEQFVTSASDLQISGTPLREFEGDLKAIKFEKAYEKTRAKLQFTGLHVIETRVPYAFPVAELDLSYSARERSVWGKLLKSAQEIGYNDIMDLREHRLHMKGVDASYGTDGDGRPIAGIDWAIIGVDGAESASAAAVASEGDKGKRIMELIDGKTSGEFATDAMNDPLFRGDNALKNSLFDGSLVASLVEDGKVTLGDDERYKVNEPHQSQDTEEGEGAPS